MDLKEDHIEQFVVSITCRKHIPHLIEKIAGACAILDGAKSVTTARVMTTIPALTDSESADCYILSGTDPVIASRVRLNNSTPKPYTRDMAIKRAALLDGTFESLRDVANVVHDTFAEQNSGRSKNMEAPVVHVGMTVAGDGASMLGKLMREQHDSRRKNMRPHCQRCNGKGVVDDGMIYGSGDIAYEGGPVRCIKDCPDCTDVPGGQS